MNACRLTRSIGAWCAGGLLLGASACGPTRPLTTATDTLATVHSEGKHLGNIKETHLAAEAYFEFGRTELSEEGKAKLDELANKVPGKQYPRVQIMGYTDRLGDERYNMQLALRRAEAVRDYLIGRGVKAEFIAVNALGPHDPLVACKGKQGDRLIRCLRPNRRTVVELSAFERVDDGLPQPAIIESK